LPQPDRTLKPQVSTAVTSSEAVEAQQAGPGRDGEGQPTDELIGQVVEAVPPARPGGHEASWEVLEAQHARIETWVRKDRLPVVKIGTLLERRGIVY
jgi:hypothetical protein